MSDHLEADLNVAAVIKSSAVFGLFDRVLGRVGRADSTSVAVSSVTKAAGVWTELDAHVRRAAVGTMLIVAVVAHLVFTLVTYTPPGWQWLIVPGLVAATGVLTLMSSGQPRA